MNIYDFVAKTKNLELNLSEMKDIRKNEMYYNKRGEEHLSHLEQIGQQCISETARSDFVFGYSECGQDMHKANDDLKNQILRMIEMIDRSDMLDHYCDQHRVTFKESTAYRRCDQCEEWHELIKWRNENIKLRTREDMETAF